MPLTLAEIQPGAIAYFDVGVLHGDAAVVVTGDPVQRDVTGNQFVCYKTKAGTSFWSPLTATFKFSRTRIKPSWVTHGYGPLAVGRVWLQDGKNTYRGPDASFVAASATEHAFDVARPVLSAAAIAAIRQAIEVRGGAL